jgi:Recombinase
VESKRGCTLTTADRAKGGSTTAQRRMAEAIVAYWDLLPWILDLRDMGFSLSLVAACLDAQGHTTRSGTAWHPAQVQRVLWRWEVLRRSVASRRRGPRLRTASEAPPAITPCGNGLVSQLIYQHNVPQNIEVQDHSMHLPSPPASKPRCALTFSARARGGRISAKRQVLDAVDAYREVVPLMVEWKSEGLTLWQIADRLNASGHRTRNGFGWRPAQVHRCLKRAESMPFRLPKRRQGSGTRANLR